ncbi:MAG: hypothetical protein U1E83_04265 [Methylotetracoccus sp.]
MNERRLSVRAGKLLAFYGAVLAAPSVSAGIDPAQAVTPAVTEHVVEGSPLLTSTDANSQPPVFGRTYAEWTAKWWQWVLLGTESSNVLDDETGALCASNQPKQKVWFLAGTRGKAGVQRQCTIPANRALLFPLVNIMWTDCPNSPDEDLTDAEVRAILAGVDDLDCQISATLDGVPIAAHELLTVRTQSTKFHSVLPKNGLGAGDCTPKIPPGRTGRQLADGYWVMVPPLSPGKHVLAMHGARCDAKTGNPLFETGVSYELKILRGP